MIDVCICTHNPRPDILAKVLAAIQNQTVSGDVFRVLVVDNASSPPLEESLLARFSQNGIVARIVREPILGVARARLRAITETNGEMLLFVDDDNELMTNYISEGVKFAAMHKDVGCFGGRILLPPNIHTATWLEPFLPYLAIRDLGEEVIFGKSDSWADWDPPTAGAFIKRSVLMMYKQRTEIDEEIFRLGRIGKGNLSSCEDALMMSGAFSLGLSNAYVPNIFLYHHLDVKRFKFGYLIRLMHAYGISNAILKSLQKRSTFIPAIYATRRRFMRLLIGAGWSGARQSLAFGIGIVAYHIGARSEYLRQYKNEK